MYVVFEVLFSGHKKGNAYVSLSFKREGWKPHHLTNYLFVYIFVSFYVSSSSSSLRILNSFP